MPHTSVSTTWGTPACDSGCVQSNTITRLNLPNLKRSRDEHLPTLTRSPKKAKRSKKAARKGADVSSISDGSDDKPRVGCPYFKRYGTLKQASCNGKGWPDPGKMKDHLKSVHKMDLEWLNKNMHFKEKPYFGQPMNVQWKLAFRKIFPDIPKDEVPSPYINDVNVPPRTAVAVEDLQALEDILKYKLLEHYKIEILCELPIIDLETVFKDSFADAVAEWKEGAPFPADTIPFEYDMVNSWPHTEHHCQSIPQPSVEDSPQQSCDETESQTCRDLPREPRPKATDVNNTLSASDQRMSDSNRQMNGEYIKIEAPMTPNLILVVDITEEDVEADIDSEVDAPTSSDDTLALDTSTCPSVLPFGSEYPFVDSLPSNLISRSNQLRTSLEFEAHLNTSLVPLPDKDSSSRAPSLCEDELENEHINFNAWLTFDTSDSCDMSPKGEGSGGYSRGQMGCLRLFGYTRTRDRGDITSLPAWRKTPRAGKYAGYFDFERL